MVELMRQNPDFTAFDMEHKTLLMAGLVAYGSIKLLFEHGTLSGVNDNVIDRSHAYNAPDGSYTVVAEPAPKLGDIASSDILGYFPNHHRYGYIDTFSTVVTRHKEQFGSDPSSITTRVVRTDLIIPPIAEEGWWVGTTATFMRDNQPDIEAQQALLKNATPETELVKNIALSARVVSDARKALKGS